MKHNNFEAEVGGTDYKFETHYLEDIPKSSFVEEGYTKDLVVDKGEVSANVWRRYKVLKRTDFTCKYCGARADRYIKLKSSVANIGNFSNRYIYVYFTVVDKTRRVFTIDHILPKSIKGNKSILRITGNYQTMCRKCNETKGATFQNLNKKIELPKETQISKMSRIKNHLKAIWNEIF